MSAAENLNDKRELSNKRESNRKKAVALRYPEGCIAPIITAKGNGVIAEQIIKTAQQENVFITENMELVNLLDSCETGSVIPEETWQAVAVIFSFILEDK